MVGSLASRPDRRQLDLFVVGGVQRIRVVRRERVDRAGQHRHRVGVARETVEEPLEVLVQHRVQLNPAGEVGQLRGAGQLAVDQQVADLDERRLLGELVDRNAAVTQDAGVAVDVGDGALASGGVDEAVVERGEAGLGQKRAERNAVVSFGRAHDLQVNLAARVPEFGGVVGVGHENPFALWLIWLPARSAYC